MSSPEECGAVQQNSVDQVMEMTAEAPSCRCPSPTVSTAASPEPIVSSRRSSSGGPRTSPRERSTSPNWVSVDPATDVRRGTRVRPGSQCSSEERACSSPRSGSSTPASPRQQHQCFLASASQAALCLGADMSQFSESAWPGEQWKQSSWLLDGFSNAPTPVDTGSPPTSPKMSTRANSKMTVATAGSFEADQESEASPSEEEETAIDDEGDDKWPIWQSRATDPDIAAPLTETWARHLAPADTDGWLLSDSIGAHDNFLSNNGFLSSDGFLSNSMPLMSAQDNAKASQAEDFTDQTIDWLVSDALGDEPVDVPDELTELLSAMGVAGVAGGDAAAHAANAELLVNELLRICPELDLEVAACPEPDVEEEEEQPDEAIAETQANTSEATPSAEFALPEAGQAEPTAEDPATVKPAAVELATEAPAPAEPASAEPAAQNPSLEEPAPEEQPPPEQPALQEPAPEEEAPEQPAPEELDTEKPAAVEPAAQELSKQELTTAMPAAEEPATTQPLEAEPAMVETEPAAEPPTVERASVEATAAAEPAAVQSAAPQPAAKALEEAGLTQPSTSQSAQIEASWEERFLQALTGDFANDFGSKEFDSLDDESTLEQRFMAALDLLAGSALQDEASAKDNQVCGSQVNGCSGPTGGSPLEPAFNHPPPESGAGHQPIKLDQNMNILAAFEQREECPTKGHTRTLPRRSRKSSASHKNKEGDGKMAEGLHRRHRKKAMASLPQLGAEAEHDEKATLHAKRAVRLVCHKSLSPPPVYQPYRRSAMEEDLCQDASFNDSETKDICYKSQRIPYSGWKQQVEAGWKQQVDPVNVQRMLSAKLAATGSPRERQWSATTGQQQRLYKTSRLTVKPPGLLPDIKAPSSNLVQSGLATVLGQSLSAPALPTCGKMMPGGLASYSSKAHGLYEKKYRCGGHELFEILKEGRLPQMMCR